MGRMRRMSITQNIPVRHRKITHIQGWRETTILEDLNPRMSQTDVSYSCGSCGYPLNLTSSSRVTSGTSPGYLKSIGKGYISFGSIDLSRFTQVDEINCFPIFCGSQGLKTKLLCRKCGMLIGYGYGESSALCGLISHTSSSASYKKVRIKIRALQPSEDSNNIENGA